MKRYQEDCWMKYYECDCHTEGIMMSYEYNESEGLPLIDIAFFQHGFVGIHPLGFWERLRWSLHLIKTGRPFLDGIMLSQKNAKRLSKDLLKFSEKKYKFGTIKKNKKAVKK